MMGAFPFCYNLIVESAYIRVKSKTKVKLQLFVIVLK